MPAFWNPYRTIDGQPTGVLVRAGAVALGGWQITNLNAAARYVKLYDKATAPTSSDTPVMTLALQPAADNNISPPSGNPTTHSGIAFLLGLGIRVTTGRADNDTGAPSAGDVVVNLFYR